MMESALALCMSVIKKVSYKITYFIQVALALNFKATIESETASWSLVHSGTYYLEREVQLLALYRDSLLRNMVDQ